jgi:beta-glucanase (GH16 family)
MIWPASRVNNELQAYTDREKNIRVEDRELIIQAYLENTTVQGVASHYTSGRITSEEKGDWLNGRIEAYAKLPGGQGTNNILVKWGQCPDTIKLTIDNACGIRNITKYLRYYC